MMVKVEDLRQALESTPKFIVATWVEQLQERARNVSDLSFLQIDLGAGLAQEKVLDGDHLKSGGAASLIGTLAQATTAHAVANLGGGDDPYNFRGCADQSVSKLNMTDVLTRLMGYCYADHLDSHLAFKGLPKLSTLQQDESLVEDYKKMFLDPDSVIEQVEHDLTVGDLSYSASLLFVANYFAHEATPLLHEPSKIWVEVFGQIAQAKIRAAVGDTAILQSDKFAALVSLMSQALTIAYAPTHDNSGQGFLRPPAPGEILQPLAGMDVPEDVKKEIDQLHVQNLQLGDWKAYGEVMVSLWDDVAAKYNGAVRSQARVETAHYEPQVWFDPQMPPPPPVITTTTGQGIKDWLSKARSSQPTLVVKDPGVNWKINVASPFGSCFIAGTEVITRSGVKKIEDLAEHDWVLTRGEFDEWGKVSDEKVEVPVEMPIMHGFNHEKPFFTAGHVFFTTTGLRALDPTLAMKENPWADVGRLAVGHVVLRLDTNKKEYEQVLITSISSETMPQVKYVYGVHLREGRRSYHANRYLVAVNYPEITMKSICKMLRTVPVEEQARMLLAFDELRPLFQRFGIGGISDILKGEVEAESERNSMRLYKTSRNKLTGPGHGSLQYPPEKIPGADYRNLLTPLPNVSVIEGVVYVDGEACKRASISNMKNEIRWVRPVGHGSGAASVFEHGSLIVDPLTRSAQGNIQYSKDIEAKQVIPIDFIQYLAMGCELAGPPSYQEAVLATPAPAYSLALFSEEHFESLTVNEVKTSDVTESGEESQADPLFIPEDETLPFMSPLRFNLIYDANRWKKGLVSPGDPVVFGLLDLAVGRKHADGLATRVAILPELDKLHDLITAKHTDSTLGKLASFYVSTLSIDSEGRTKISIAMTPNAQELLRGFRDKPKADDDEYSLKWTFKEALGDDVTLGMLFSSLELTLGPDQKTATGSIVEYSLDSDTGEGMKHLLLSNPGDTARRVDIETRTDGSNTAGGVSTGSPTTPISTPQVPPPPPRLGPKGPYHVSTLEAIPYNNEDLEKKSKTVLEDMMYFHMETTDLNDIFNKKQPDSLPDHLAKGLPSNLRNWIKDVYSPAFTALTIAESYNTKDWQSKFTAKERSRILYFWQGDGPKCLSSSLEYKQLNQLAVREAMLRLYSVLEQFVTDGGSTWAETYYKEVKANKLYDAAEQVVVGNQQPLQKYCNILYVLDPDSQYAKEFYEDVVDIAAGSLAIQQTTLSGDTPPWLPHATKALVEALLNPNDKSIPENVRKAFMKDFEEFCKEQNIEFERENKEKLANALLAQLNLAASVPKALGAATLFAKGLYYRSKTVVGKGAWLKENDMSKSGGKLATTIKMLALFANVANIIFNKDAAITDSEKAKMGGTIAKNVMDILGPHFVKTGPRSTAQIHAETAILNDKARKTPFGWRRGKLVEQKVKYMEKLGEEALQQERNVARGGGLLSRLKSKLSVPPRIMRMIGIAIAVAFIGFLIWDLVAHGGAMSGGQLALGIINIVLEVAIVIVEVLGLIFPAVSFIPVIGQILAIAVIVVGILVMIFGNTEHQKTPGEKFVDRMRANDGWLSKIDDPPGALLTASISSQSGNKNTACSFTVTLTNSTKSTISFIDAASAAPGTPPSLDRINSVEVSFFAGSDDTTLFSNSAFARAGEAVPLGSGTWAVTTPGAGGTQAWDVAMQKPNGTNLRSTNFNLRVKGIPNQTATISPNQTMAFTISGTLGLNAGTSLIKVIEKRPGAPFCPSTFEMTRN